ncbi:MAG: siderophore-interacting protein [Trueperaceae bacterium]
MTLTRTKSWTGPNHTGEVQVNLIENLGRRILTVSRVETLTPNYVRVYLTGDALAGGFPYVHLAPTDHVKVLFPQPGTTEVVMPTRGPKGWVTEEGAPEPILRDYTVRGWLPETKELILEFVKHGHGVASNWAASAKAGDQLGVMGPRGNRVFPENYAWYLLAGDESVLPALGRFAEELPDAARAHIFVEVANAAERRQLTDRSNVEVTWVLRDEEGDGGLERALRAVKLPENDDWFVFAAGEAGALKPIRDYFRLELGLPRERVSVDGYWKRGLANLDHHSINLDED